MPHLYKQAYKANQFGDGGKATYFSEQLDPALYYLRPLNNLNLTMTLKDDNHNCTLNFNLEKGVRRRLNYTTQWSEDGTRETKSNRS